MKDNFNTNLIESIVRMSNNLRSDSDYIESHAETEFKNISKISSDSVEININNWLVGEKRYEKGI